MIRLTAAAILIGLAVWLHRLALSIADGPSRWMAEPRRFTKHLSWSEICDGAALAVSFVALGLILFTLFADGRKDHNKTR